MKLSALAISAVLAASACSGGDGNVCETTTSTVPATATTTSMATTTTTIPTETGGTVTTPGSGFVIGEADYVLAAGGTIQSVSPDARVLVIADGEHVDLQSLDGSDAESVPSPPEFRLGRLVGGWAADGSVVAFHDAFSTAVNFDSTVWLLDTREPALQLLVSEQDILVLDVAFAPDGDVVLLGDQTDHGFGLFTVSDSGEPQPLAPVQWQNVVEWLPDGSALVTTAFTSGEEAGLWRVDPRDGSSELVSPPDAVLGSPHLVAVSGDSAWALIFYRIYVAQEFPANASHYGVVRLETGEVSPLKEPTDRDFFGPGLAAFSPDGEWVAYTYHDGQDMDAPVVLAVRPTAGGEEQIISGDLFAAVGSPPTPSPFFLERELNPVWAADNRLVFPTSSWALVIDLE